MGTISLSLLEQVMGVQTWSECSPDKLFPGPPRLATAWLSPAEVCLCQLQTLRGTWSTSQPEFAPLTSLQCAWESSPKNGDVQQWRGRQLWERHLQQIQPCTCRSHCQRQEQQRLRHTSWWMISTRYYEHTEQ